MEDLAPYFRHEFGFAVVRLADDPWVTVPVKIAVGSRPTPLLVEITAVHGNEPVGMLALRDFWECCDPACLDATAILIPVAELAVVRKNLARPARLVVRSRPQHLNCAGRPQSCPPGPDGVGARAAESCGETPRERPLRAAGARCQLSRDPRSGLRLGRGGFQPSSRSTEGERSRFRPRTSGGRWRLPSRSRVASCSSWAGPPMSGVNLRCSCRTSA
jgi:hypothetical protein